MWRQSHNKADPLDYNASALELDEKEQKRPEYLELNPNGCIPTIIDRDAGDFIVFETGASLLYLARRKAVFYRRTRNFGD